MARSTHLRAICVVATATVASGFLSPSCSQHCGGSPSSSFAAPASATHVASRRCTSSAWRPAAVPARNTRLGDLRMVSHRHVVHVLIVFLKLCPDFMKRVILRSLVHVVRQHQQRRCRQRGWSNRPLTLQPSCMPHSLCVCVFCYPSLVVFSVGFGRHGHYHQRPEGSTGRGGLDTQRCVLYEQSTAVVASCNYRLVAGTRHGCRCIVCVYSPCSGGFLGTVEANNLGVALELPRVAGLEALHTRPARSISTSTAVCIGRCAPATL